MVAGGVEWDRGVRGGVREAAAAVTCLTGSALLDITRLLDVSGTFATPRLSIIENEEEEVVVEEEGAGVGDGEEGEGDGTSTTTTTSGGWG